MFIKLVANEQFKKYFHYMCCSFQALQINNTVSLISVNYINKLFCASLS